MLERILREPLVHFLLIGIGLFVVFGLMNKSDEQVGENVIIVSDQDVERLQQSFEGVWRRIPTDEELAALVDDHVLEEVLVREATALGLDQNDTVIRRRLRQKMDFLVGAAGSALQPDDEELAAFFAESKADFTTPPRVSFMQVYLGESPSEAEVAAALDALKDGADPATVGQRSLLPQGLPATPEQGVDGQYGRGMFAQVVELPKGVWSGPVSSGYGKHLVSVLEVSMPETPELDSIREQVISAWRAREVERLSESQYQALRDRYTVELPEGGA
jgi:hypothetical protein